MNKALLRATLWTLGALVVIVIVAALSTILLGQGGSLGIIAVLAGTLGGKIVTEYRKARAGEADRPVP